MPAKVKKAPSKRAPAKKPASAPRKPNYTHIDRSSGVYLRASDLDKKKPWLSPVTGQATVEELTKDERENMPGAQDMLTVKSEL